MDHAVVAASRPVCGPRHVPASKSLHQRALALSALADRAPVLEAGGIAPGDDVRRLAAALVRLGPWTGGALGASRERREVHLGLGATGFRFTVALATLRPDGARTLVRGHPRLLARPHAPLRRALTRLGGHVRRRGSGAIRVRGGGVRGARVDLRGDLSSQFASALLLIAPRIEGIEVRFRQPPVSRPYLDLTVDVLRAFGVPVRTEGLDGAGGTIAVSASAPALDRYRVEVDASCAAPWWAAAALTGGAVHVAGLPRGTRQADAALLGVLERMGARVEDAAEGGVVVAGDADPLRSPGVVDLRDAPDLLPVVGALAAVADGTTRLTGAGHARFKESNRLETVAAAIRALRGRAEVEGDALVVHGGPLAGGVIDCAGDHRLVLAFGALGLRVPGVILRGADAVVKSYPAFLEELDRASAPDGGDTSGGGPR